MAVTTKKSLADLAGAFAKKTNEDNNSTATWKLFFPFWKADVDTTSVVRFLPDLAEDNPLGFLVENLTHTLIVNGKRETVACAEMHGEKCPICEASRAFYQEAKDAGETRERPGPLTEKGRKLYRKKDYIGQIIVMDTPLEHNQDQLVKLVEFGPKIFKQIQAAFQSGDLENPPYELKGGHNFRFNKTQSGQYADYGTSSFAPRASDVSDDIIEQIELFDLAAHRAQRIPREQLEAMLAADQAGGVAAPRQARAEAPVAPKAAPAPAASSEDAGDTGDTGEDAGEAPATAPKLSIAEQIRQRQAARKAAAEAGDE